MVSGAAGPVAQAAEANWARYRPGQSRGHYESFFLRGNHPERPLAFWIRYTMFSPEGNPERALGELWAVYFDGETNRHAAVKSEVPFAECSFGRREFAVRIAASRLEPGRATGRAEGGGHEIDWDLGFDGLGKPVLLLPRRLYEAKLPRAKSLVPVPVARFSGRLRVDGKTIDVEDWLGSQNHNWGSRHTDRYAWGQVVAFETHPDSFLEVATARLKFGPIWSPFLTVLVLRHCGQEFRANSLCDALRARASLRYFAWDFDCRTRSFRIAGKIHAPREAFVGLRYANPPGGFKQCLNTKLAACRVELTDLRTQPPACTILSTAHRAAFEILTDNDRHGIPMRA